MHWNAPRLFEPKRSAAAARNLHKCALVFQKLAIALLAVPLALVACSDSVAVEDDEETADSELVRAENLDPRISCRSERQPAYANGVAVGSMSTFTIGGNTVTRRLGNAFLALERAAAARGLRIWINSGFRTMAEQQRLYDCYRTRSCNGGHLAARPGFSRHQNGRAIDIGTDDRARLSQVIRELGSQWRQTVASEPWHYEYFGADPGGPCGAAEAAESTSPSPAPAVDDADDVELPPPNEGANPPLAPGAGGNCRCDGFICLCR